MSRNTVIALICWALMLGVGSAAIAQSPKEPAPKSEAQKKVEGKSRSVTPDKLDPSFFEAVNQRECDRPRACGCNCEDAPPPTKSQ